MQGADSWLVSASVGAGVCWNPESRLLTDPGVGGWVQGLVVLVVLWSVSHGEAGESGTPAASCDRQGGASLASPGTSGVDPYTPLLLLRVL